MFLLTRGCPEPPKPSVSGYRVLSLFSTQGDITSLWSTEKKALRTQPPKFHLHVPISPEDATNWTLGDRDTWQLESFPATGKLSRLLYLCMRWQYSPFIPDHHGPGPGTRGIGQNALLCDTKTTESNQRVNGQMTKHLAWSGWDQQEAVNTSKVLSVP